MQNNRPLKLIICGNYGATNLGDEAILDGILRLVRSVAPQAEITVLSADPTATMALHGSAGEQQTGGSRSSGAGGEEARGAESAPGQTLKSLPLLPAGIRSFFRGLFSGTVFKTIDAIRKCDAFILGGGGLFTDEKMMAIVIWSLQANFAAFFKKPIFSFAQSVGPLTTSYGRTTTAKVFSKSKAITVRDFASWKLLKEMWIDFAHQLADPAFALHIDVPPAHVPEKYVVLSVRPWGAKIAGMNKEESEPNHLYKNYAQFIFWLYKEYGFKTILVPFQILVDNDLDVANKIYSHLVLLAGEENAKKIAEIYEYTASPQKVIELIARSEAVIGMRLHSLIFATLTCTPFLAISYSEKVSHFVEDLNLEDFIIPYEDVSAKVLESRFKLLMRDREKIETALTEGNLLMREKCREHERLLRDFLAKIS